jgi:hypothetical protein
MKLNYLAIALLSCWGCLRWTGEAIAWEKPAQGLWGNPSCAVSRAEILQKHELRKAAFNSQSTAQAQTQYQAILQKHRQTLQSCRDRLTPQTQATWLRLYAHDAQDGILEDVFDRIANRGYNQVFIETLYDGRILLPVADNPTPWRSVMAEAVAAGQVPADYDLLQRAIALGQERGIKVYSWVFAMNFGYGYSEVRGKASTFALNGNGDNSIANTNFNRQQVANGRAFYEDAYEVDNLFIDPFNAIARKDLINAIQAISQRQPDGMVFDYIRYPNNANGSPIDNVKQLWIYGQSSRSALLNSIGDRYMRELMTIYLQNGEVTRADITNIEQKLANTLNVQPSSSRNPNQDLAIAQRFLWQIATNHAYRGVLEFITVVTAPLQQNNIPIGTVFFPGGNRTSQGKVNPKMQPWDRFPAHMERHPMTYAICNDGSCVAQEVSEVVRQSPTQTRICPVLAGTWGQSFNGHASLEVQTQAIQKTNPQINCISHFVYSWMEPDSDRLRKAGTATGQEPITTP